MFTQGRGSLIVSLAFLLLFGYYTILLGQRVLPPRQIEKTINKKVNAKTLAKKGLSLSAPMILTSAQQTQGEVLFSEDFENGQGEWELHGGLWEIGTPTSGPSSAYSGGKVAATNLSGNYPDDATAHLISPTINLPALAKDKDQIRLRFFQWYETESSYDYCYVLVSNDGGQNWTELGSYDGSQEYWVLTDLDLSSYAGSSVKISFSFSSDYSANYAGWYVDAISVEYIEQLYTEEIEIAVAGNGQFTMGIPDGPILLYGHPDPWSSATTIRVDGVDYWNYNRTTWGTVVTPPTTQGFSNTTTWDINGLVRLTQKLSIVQGSSSRKYDTGEIRYTVVNTDNTAHSVGIRIMLDTMLGTNDGAPFRIPGTGAVTTEMEWDRESMPPYYQAFDDLINHTIQSQGTLIGGSAICPDRFVTTGWKHINDTPWEYATDWGNDYLDDSAVGIYWSPVSLNPGESKDFVTYYGLGGMDIDLQPPLVTALTAPNSIILLNGESTGNPFTLTVYLSNTSPGVTQTARGVATILTLPDGLELASGESARHDLPDLDVGVETQTSYQIKVKPSAAGEQVYSLDVTATNITSKTVQKDIYVFGIQTNPVDGGEIGADEAISARFNVDMDASTIDDRTFTVSDGTQNIDGNVIYDANSRTAYFQPAEPLDEENNYAATLSSNIKSENGIALPYGVVWNFTTESNYDLGFKPGRDGWRFGNTESNMWPENWWQQFDYSQDPYLDPHDLFLINSSQRFPDWWLFVDAFGHDNCYFNGGIPRPYAHDLWLKLSQPHFHFWPLPHYDYWKGSCFGFAISSFLAFDNKAAFLSKFPDIKDFNVLYDLQINENTRKCINQLWIYQFGKYQLAHINANRSKTPVQTLNEIKQMFRSDIRDDRILVLFNQNGSGGHAVNPYKVERDPYNPNLQYIYVYDNNYPDQDDLKIEINKVSNTWSYPWVGDRKWGGSRGLFLMEPISNYFSNPVLPKKLPLRKRWISDDSNRSNYYEVFNTPNASISIRDAWGNTIGYRDSVAFNNLDDGIAIIPITGGFQPPIGYYLPNATYSVEMREFSDSTCYFSIFIDSTVFSYSRSDADSTQKDYLTYGNSFAVINQDRQKKAISFESVIIRNNNEKVFQVENCKMSQNDSLKFAVLNRKDLKITNLGSEKNYDIKLRLAAANADVIFEHKNI